MLAMSLKTLYEYHQVKAAAQTDARRAHAALQLARGAPAPGVPGEVPLRLIARQRGEGSPDEPERRRSGRWRAE